MVPGLNASGWQNYRPLLRGFSFLGGGITQPILSDERNSIGRYTITNQGFVKGQAQITFAAADALGSGETVWGIRLPFPANRSSGGADLPIGTAFLWQGSAANPQLNLIGQVTLMDPLEPAGSQGREDSFVQVFLSKLISFGSVTFGSASLTSTVTHGLASGYTPNAYDIKLTLTNTPSTNPQWISAQNIGATTFDIVLRASATTTPATVAWKIESEPNNSSGFALLMNSQKPWAWAAGHSIGINFEYEARR